MAENELIIKIAADAKNAQKAFDDIKDKTEDLEGQLATIAKISGVAFAALTAEVVLAAHAFEDSEQSSRKLTLSLQNQGIFSAQLAESYKARSASLQKLTGFDDDAITKGQALLQGFIGQKQVTDELTRAALDLAQAQGGDVVGGFQSLGRAINGNVRELKAYGITIDEGLSKSERMAQVTERVAQVLGGQAEAANKGLGGLRGLRSAISDVQEELGARFAPIIESVIKSLTGFFASLKDNQKLIDLGAGLIGAGIAITGLITGLSLLAPALFTAQALALAFGTTIAASLGPIGIAVGLLTALGVAVGVYVANTGPAKTATQELDADIQKMTETVTKLQAQTKNPSGVLLPATAIALLDTAQKKLDELIEKREALGAAEIKRTPAGGGGEQDAALAAAAAKRQALEDAQNKAKLDAVKANQAAIRLENEFGSQALIEIKRKEAAILQQLSTEDNLVTRELLKTKYAETVALEAEQRAQDKERKAAFDAEDLQVKVDNENFKAQATDQIRQEDLAKAQGTLLTEKEVEAKIQLENLNNRIKSRNTELEEKKKYGATVAALNSVFNSNEVKAAADLSSQLIGMQNSRNSILRTIGKAAAVTNVLINTAQGATAAYTRSIEAFGPIVGPIVGGALAAAVVAFGAEQVGNIAAAADGGLVSGGIAGRDSVPILAQPGELIVPTKLVPSFLDVVGNPQAGKGGNADLMPVLMSIDSKLSQPSQTIINGDVMADSAFIDVLIAKINERLEFGNARFVAAGV